MQGSFHRAMALMMMGREMEAGGSGPSAKEYWISDVDPIVQSQCKGCHQTGGLRQWRKLLFTDSDEDNHLAMQSL